MVFDPREYDEWYDRHYELYQMELETLRPLVARYLEPGLEVGVGTGRFAAELGIAYGLDIDEKMLEFARQRGIKVVRGYAENMPYTDGYFGRVLVVTAFPFFENPKKAVSEIHRVLVDNGGLVVGMIPKYGPFGNKYENLKNSGDERFNNATFFSVAELKQIVSEKFKLKNSRSLIMEKSSMSIVRGAREDAMFVAMEWIKRL